MTTTTMMINKSEQIAYERDKNSNRKTSRVGDE